MNEQQEKELALLTNLYYMFLEGADQLLLETEEYFRTMGVGMKGARKVKHRLLMSQFSTMRNLMEDELELLQEEIEGDLYEEIDKVLDDKRQPSLFCQGVKVGDVYICDCFPRGKSMFRIKNEANPNFIVEVLSVDKYGVYYSNHSTYKADEMLKWRKVGKENWELMKENYENWLKGVERIKGEAVEYYGKIWDKLNNEEK